jgi:hypothetical protein
LLERRHRDGAAAEGTLALERGLLPGVPAHLPLEPLLGRAAGGFGSPRGSQQLLGLGELLPGLGPRE